MSELFLFFFFFFFCLNKRGQQQKSGYCFQKKLERSREKEEKGEGGMLQKKNGYRLSLSRQTSKNTYQKNTNFEDQEKAREGSYTRRGFGGGLVVRSSRGGRA